MWNAHHRHFAKDSDPILVWQAPTRTMNPLVPQSLIGEAMEQDAARVAAECLAVCFQCPLNTSVLNGSASAWSRKIKACTSPRASTT